MIRKMDFAPSLRHTGVPRPQSLAIVALASACLLTLDLLAPQTAAQTGQDPMLVHYEGAHEALRSGDQERASAEYKSFLAEATHRIANARARIGEPAAAEEAFQESLSLEPDNSGVKLDYAAVLLDEEQIERARALASSASNSDPQNERAVELLGKIAFQQQDYATAKQHLEWAARDSASWDVWRLLALSDLRLRKTQDAGAVFSEFLKRFGDTPDNRVRVAKLYYYGDYPELAAKELRRVLQEKPNQRDAHYYLGLTCLANNESAGYNNAAAEFSQELKVDPRHFPSTYMLGYIALQQRRFADAEEELLKALLLKPEDSGTNLLLGQLYVETRRFDEAKKVLLTITSGSGSPPDNVTIRAHYMLGRLLLQLGNAAEGVTQIRTAERLRRTLRVSSTEAHERGSSDIAESRADSTLADKSASPVPVTTAERQQAQRFAAQISPLIGEAYYNLSRIARLREDTATAVLYAHRAAKWDPSLASTRPQ